MKASLFPQHSFRGFFIVLISGLGAGFPLLFICDAGVGGSPINSWGKITLIDIPNGGIRPGGFLLDFLFYTVLIWIIWFAVAVIFQKSIHRPALWWAASLASYISLGCFVALWCFFQVSYTSRVMHVHRQKIRSSSLLQPRLEQCPRSLRQSQL